MSKPFPTNTTAPQKSRALSLAHILVLTHVALATTPKGELEESLQGYADDTLNVIPGYSEILDNLVDRELLETNEDGDYSITPFGMKHLLNSRYPNPNFDHLASSDFSVAFRMFVSGHEALVKFVSNSETGQIVPKKDTKLVDTLIGIADWIDDVTVTYRDSLKTKPSKKSK